MRVTQRRWGEVTVKKQGDGKNKFHETKSFSVQQTDSNYTLESYHTILKLVTDLTATMSYGELKRKLEGMQYWHGTSVSHLRRKQQV